MMAGLTHDHRHPADESREARDYQESRELEKPLRRPSGVDRLIHLLQHLVELIRFEGQLRGIDALEARSAEEGPLERHADTVLELRRPAVQRKLEHGREERNIDFLTCGTLEPIRNAAAAAVAASFKKTFSHLRSDSLDVDSSSSFEIVTHI